MDALTALRLQFEWGADEALEEAPVDRLRPPAPVIAIPVDRPAQPTALQSGGTAVERAQAAAASARSLPLLREVIAAFEGCALRDTATQTVLPDGDAGRLLLVTEAPSADDDRAGRPLSGAQGAYLDGMLASIGLDRKATLIAPLIPWRPPGDRPPNPGELAICLPFLLRMITLSTPTLALLLGPLASRTLAGLATTARVRRGTWIDMKAAGLPPLRMLPTHSVGALLSQPRLRREAWADLRALRRALDGVLAPK